uniref:Cytochrome P450 n=1 Tax=Dendroctonus armandi TaxID=77159 RepID=A0A0M3RSR5_9CUCU|nr:cytochrome P450 [Dendroctonus armandi]
MSLLILLTVLLLAFAIKFAWKRRFLYRAAAKFQGPVALPLIGNAWLFMCKNEDILMRIYGLSKKYPDDPVRFWLGPSLIIMLSNPHHLEKILSSSKFAHKHDIYDLLKVFTGEGLITSSGSLHKEHRHLIQPMLTANFSQDSVAVMQKHAERCMDILEAKLDQDMFDIEDAIHQCMIDANKELILGSTRSSQLHGYSKYDRALTNMYNLGFTRLVKPYLQPEMIYNLTPYKRRQEDLIHAVKDFIKQVVQQSKERRAHSCPPGDIYPVVDRIRDVREERPDVISDKVFEDHLLTLYAAAEDPSTITCSFLALCFGLYPEYQERAAKEIMEVFGETPSTPSWEALSKLQYLDMCLKDVLRLFPIGPIILRKCTSDFLLDDKWLIPKNCGIALPIFAIHRDPRYWSHPDHFYPDHFLPESTNQRHPYAYLPFSAGSRGCIGKLLANTIIKVFTCNLLQRFEIEAAGTLAEVELKMDISTRPKRGYRLKLKRRVWK